MTGNFTTRSRAEEFLQVWLSHVIHDCNVPGVLTATNPSSKPELRLWENLADRDKFIYWPLIFMMFDGKQVIDSNGKAIVVKKASDPFFGPYIHSAIRYLLFERASEFPYSEDCNYSASCVCLYIGMLSDLSCCRIMRQMPNHTYSHTIYSQT